MLNMGFWSFLTLVCVATILVDAGKKWMKYNSINAPGRRASDEIIARLEALEARMANLESICVEQERVRKFDDALIRAAVENKE